MGHHTWLYVIFTLSSRDRKRPAGQVCIGEAFSKLAKYERDSGKWKIPTRNVATQDVIPIPQRAHADLVVDQCINRMLRHNTTG